MPIPAKIGRYEIKSELGRGGMATVYHGFDPRFDREVAIKVLPREMLHDPQFRSRFERELKIVASLEHPAIVPVYDVGEEDGQPYFVMRYMGGGSLSSEMEKGKFSLQDTARIVEKVAQGLAYAHRKGIVHRDRKPDNILFDETGAPFISDFGVAKLTESTGSLTGSGIIGTPAYMSPEQAQGTDIDGRSDVYGLGVIVYQMLSGQQPYNADTPMGVVVKHITEPVPEILKTSPTLHPDLDKIIKTAMAKDRNKRYSSAIELAKALNVVAFGSEGDLANVTSIRTGQFRAPNLSRGKTAGFAVAGVVVVVLLVGAFLLRNQLFPAADVTPTSAPTNTPAPTEAVASPLPFAPACAAGITFPVPDIIETNKDCIQKIPYTSLSIPEGATFKPLEDGLTCKTERTSNGRTLIACTGQQLFSFDLQVCMPPVVANSDLNKCDANSTFNLQNQCCITNPPEGQGCTIFKVDITGCG